VRKLMAGCLIWLFASLSVASANQCEASHESLDKVGETRLKVFLFNVYDASLFTDTGAYEDFETLALRIDYLRDISAKALIERTEKEWGKLEIEVTERHREWLEELEQTWPDIKKGDCLVAYWQKNEGLQFINRDGRLGESFPDEFAEDFVSIWLAEESSYRENRNELVGERND